MTFKIDLKDLEDLDKFSENKTAKYSSSIQLPDFFSEFKIPEDKPKKYDDNQDFTESLESLVKGLGKNQIKFPEKREAPPFSKLKEYYVSEINKSDKYYYKKIKEINKINKIIDLSENKNSKKISENNINNIITIMPMNNMSPVGFSISDKEVYVTAENLCEFALPIVEFIHQTQPDCVLACDRGARLLGLAVFRLYNQLYGRLPTYDGSVKFRRISSSNSEKVTEEHLKPLVSELMSYAQELKERPTVLVLDDWVVSGSTRSIARQTFDRLSNGMIKMQFGVLMGSNADVTGNDSRGAGFASCTDWRDDSRIIGVCYDNGQNYNEGAEAAAVRSSLSRSYRRRMYAAIDEFVDNIEASFFKEKAA